MRRAPHQSVTGLLAALFAAFLIIAALIAAAAAVTLFTRGTPLSSIWNSKESTYHELLRHRLVYGTGFTLLAVALAVAAAGWIAGRRWDGSSASSSSGLIH
jgi:ABC-type Fe3+ transport system permease subunit